MSSAVIVTATFIPREGASDQVVSALKKGIENVHQEKGCELYALHAADDGTLTIIEKWESVDALQEHAAGTAVANLDKSLVGLLTAPPLVVRLLPVPTGTLGAGTL
jgi:quinol monooxygenase YgiN